ncbi:hypothetical protein [Streptomyces sp. NBC_01304]|uniref:hypothetical protein n=1 Tax=Streptomyces sp. NBC_01304 TaxID=2903818 RepID=UPI002E126BCC|nr:hypothetical protein OG430_12325 [Streptomyces sp. NBC_01304]
MSVSVPRLLTACGATALLALTATACADDGQAVGVVTYSAASQEAEAGGHGEAEAAEESGGHGEAAAAEEHSKTNPYLKGCHKMAEPATKVHNNTNADLVAFTGADCTGESKHIGSKTADATAPHADAWQSYNFTPHN